ncbi:hypothetical protein CEXT_652141 [Caerostris extrusa]|uniref:Uncharacterized protein n=1 Tax=Caerostris extrusa TaxID=172846 RepID=A0AAV4SBE5_CAEEX|nr:hypothetical protein CEXT_652141 [Caerostris extrusa]
MVTFIIRIRRENLLPKLVVPPVPRVGPVKVNEEAPYQSSKQSSKSCCVSCSRGAPCERDRRNHYQPPTKCSKSCCTSYSKGGMRESDRRSHCSSSKPSTYSTCSGRRKIHHPLPIASSSTVK